MKLAVTLLSAVLALVNREWSAGMDWVRAGSPTGSGYGVKAGDAVELQWSVHDHVTGLEHHGIAPKHGASATVLPDFADSPKRRHVVVVSTRLLRPLPLWRE